MAGVAFEALPPGAREEWLNETDRRAHDSLYVGDIRGARPGRFDSIKSSRHYNNPLEPSYQIPQVPTPEALDLHARTQQPLGPKHNRHDPNDINAKRVSRFSSLSETPARDLMRTNDIIGGGRTVHREINKGYDSMQVSDINNDGIFRSTRQGANPLEPSYQYDPGTHTNWEIPGAHPAGFRELSDNPDLRLRNRDIAGCVPDTIGGRTRSMITRQVLRTDDIECAQANTVRQAMRTTRCSNPLEPIYKPLQSETDIGPTQPRKLCEMRDTAPVQGMDSVPRSAATPGALAADNRKRAEALMGQVQERLNQKGGRMRHQFVKFDQNHDGTINHDEFKEGLVGRQGLGMALSTPEVNLLINHVDRNNSGRIDYIEFADNMKAKDETVYKSLGAGATDFRIKTPLAEHDEMTEEERVDRALDVKLHYAVQQRCDDLVHEFRKFDTDGDSMLSRGELRRGLQRVGLEFSPEEFKRLVQRMDRDDTGFVDYSEFTKHMQAPESLQKEAESRGALIHNKAFHDAQQKSRVPHMLSTPEKRDRDLILNIRDKADQRSSNVRRLMARFDDDGNGTLEYPEFRRGLEMGLNIRLSNQEFGRIVQLFDKDNSGQIDYLEFAEQIKGKEFGKEELYVRPSPEKAGSKPGSSGKRQGGSGRSTPSVNRLARAKEREERQAAINEVQSLPESLPQRTPK